MNYTGCNCSRRGFLGQLGAGFGTLALEAMLRLESRADAHSSSPLIDPLQPYAPRAPHFKARAKSVIFLFMVGGPSQVDTFDYKPELQKQSGQPLPNSLRDTLQATKFANVTFGCEDKLFGSPYSWRQYGESGMWVSELFPHIAQHVDDLCFIHSMQAESNNHAPASYQLHTGDVRVGKASLGSWTTYGLGSENQDLPGYVVLFDAGPPRTPAEQDCLIATGYLRLGPHDNAAKLFDEQDRSRAELMADLTETTATAFLGLTLSCCRCHDHKYDPFSQADHYRFRAFFAAVQFADNRPLDLAAEQAAIREHNGPLDAQFKPLREKLDALPADDKSGREELQQQVKAIEDQRRQFTHGLLMTDDIENVAATQLLYQGDHKSPREAVDAGFFSVFDPQPAAIMTSHNPRTSGRRLTLATWVASPQNPLTARVFVNRVWHYLMGQPLVATPNDFGLAGSRAENPALVDWLASEFMRHDWSVKRLVRQIVTSSTYRQAPTFSETHFALRAPRRLSAEQLRDSLLFVSGLLTPKCDGPPVWPDLPLEILTSNPAFLDDNAEKTKGWYPSPKPEQYCRSLFLVQKRNTRVPLLESFDLPDNSTPCARREVSTVAPQAMMLLNSPLATEAARAFAERVRREAGTEPTAQVQRAFELALQRAPDEFEAETCNRLLNERSLAELCRALLNLNEFAYAD